MISARTRALTGVVVLATTAALALGTTGVASAHKRSGPTVSDPIVQGLIGPLQLDVGKRGVFVSQVFKGAISKVEGGVATDVVNDAVSGVAVGKHHIAYTTNVDEGTPSAEVKVAWSNGTTTSIADLQAFEETVNPDAKNEYGLQGVDDYCAAQIPAEIAPFVLPYKGLADTNPYALTRAPKGGWYVADAGANAILHVSWSGKIRVVTVFKPQPVRITAEAAANNGLPECTVGKTFRAEPVPTDVEVGKNGKLFVTLLPGGPEDESLGARGSVVRVTVSGKHGWGWGKQKVIATGLLGATNLALTHDGKIFATELFGNRISRVRQGSITPYVEVPSPAALESYGGKLYATVDAFGNGSIVTIRR